MPFDLDRSLREIMGGLDTLHAEGRTAEAEVRKWTDIARKAKDLVAAARPVTEPPLAEFTCATCAAPLLPTAKFCRACGTKVERKPIEVKLVCASCGGAITDKTRFCGTCGKAVNKP